MYVSNETNAACVVDFDDLTIEHAKTPIVFASDYYPFGLEYNGFSRNYSQKVRFKFQDQESDEETGWIAFKWRNHQPEIGRFFNLDPLAEDYYYNSTYAFSENKVVRHIELEGLESIDAIEKEVNEPIDEINSTVANTVEKGREIIDQGATKLKELANNLNDKVTSVLTWMENAVPQTMISENNPDAEYFPPNPDAMITIIIGPEVKEDLISAMFSVSKSPFPKLGPSEKRAASGTDKMNTVINKEGLHEEPELSREIILDVRPDGNNFLWAYPAKVIGNDTIKLPARKVN